MALPHSYTNFRVSVAEPWGRAIQPAACVSRLVIGTLSRPEGGCRLNSPPHKTTNSKNLL
jgi:hypothetical protein